MRKVRKGRLTLFFPRSQTGFRKVLPERPAIKKTKSEYTAVYMAVYMAELIKRSELIVRVLGIAFLYCHLFCTDLSMSVMIKVLTFGNSVQDAALSPTNKT